MFDAADRRLMRKALALAKKGVGLASPNPSVGCLIVRDGRIVGRGWHEYDLLHHAEVQALREAGARSKNATGAVFPKLISPFWKACSMRSASKTRRTKRPKTTTTN